MKENEINFHQDHIKQAVVALVVVNINALWQIKNKY